MELIQPKVQEYFKPYTVWTVHLPEAIIAKLSQISFGKGKVAEKRMDRVMIKLSQMVERHQNYEKKHGRKLKCIPIGRDKWISLAGSIAYYTELEKIICDSGVICRVLDFTGKQSYKIGDYARGYYVDYLLMESKIVEVKLKHPTECKPEVSEQQKWLVESYKYLMIPTLEEVLYKSDSMIGKTTKRNQTIIPSYLYNSLDSNTIREYVDIEDHITLYIPLMCYGFSEPHYQFNGRMIDSISGLPSWIRDEMITIDGEKAISCDFKALHHNVWWRIFHEEMKRTDDKKKIFPEHELQWWNENVNGDGHTKLARAILREEGIVEPTDEQLHEMRKEVKLETLSHYNTTKYGMMWKGKDENKQFSRMFKIFKKYVPTLYYFIIDTKNSPYDHCNTSILMTRVESKLIQSCIKRLSEENIHCVYVHDCLMVSESNSIRCKDIMNSECSILNIPTYVE